MHREPFPEKGVFLKYTHFTDNRPLCAESRGGWFFLSRLIEHSFYVPNSFFFQAKSTIFHLKK